LLKKYYYLAKPGIIYGNLITTIAGFALASRGQVRFPLLLATLVGISLVIASACVFNNLLDRRIDALMSRTHRRALVKGTISTRYATIYGAILGLAGFTILIAFTNLLTLSLAEFAVFAYVVLYGIAKRRSVHGTLVGSVSGAMPPVIGYVAVTGRLDLGAALLFAILTLWQMPHFFAIAIFRMEDYAAAKIPVLPVARGSHATKIQMVVYSILFILAILSLSAFGYTGNLYTFVMSAVSMYWLLMCIRGFKAPDDAVWARGVFRFSLVVITIFSLMVILDHH
jgi:heme o synthase